MDGSGELDEGLGHQVDPDTATAAGSPAFSVRGLSERTGVPSTTLRRWADSGVLPCEVFASASGKRRTVVFAEDVVIEAERRGVFVRRSAVPPRWDHRSRPLDAPSPVSSSVASGTGVPADDGALRMSPSDDFVLAQSWADRAKVLELERDLADTRLAAAQRELERLRGEVAALRSALAALVVDRS